MSDYYQILEIDRAADEQTIKSAFRKLAMVHHPDKGGDITKFQEIQEAYAVLSNPEKRANYDRPQPQYQTHYQHGPGTVHFEFDIDQFEDIIGPNHPFYAHRRKRTPVNQNIQLQTAITLEEAFTGKELIANLTLPSGKEETINIKIPAGIHHATTLRLSGMGDDSLPDIPRGDILLYVHVQDHVLFRRQGDDLIQDIEINAIDAMLGKTVVVASIDHKQLQTEVPAGLQHDSMLSLTGCGMPNFNDPTRRGKLLLRIKIKIPTCSEEQKEILRKLNIV